jgi:hypothetical protein
MKIPHGYITIMYNVVIFAVACIMLILGHYYPEYKAFIIITSIGIVLVNIHSMLRFYWNNKHRKKLEQQRKNIVPSYCPDYWVKESTPSGSQCKNEFVVAAEPLEDKGERIYTIGPDKKTIGLQQYADKTNSIKCMDYKTGNYPWIDVDNKCKASGDI